MKFLKRISVETLGVLLVGLILIMSLFLGLSLLVVFMVNKIDPRVEIQPKCLCHNLIVRVGKILERLAET